MSKLLRNYSLLDQLFASANTALQTLAAMPIASRPSPVQEFSDQLNEKDVKLSAQLMRVDHAGEVCAQALYLGHALIARSQKIKQHMQVAAQEENDHLAWCAERLGELHSHTSYLNPIWFGGSFLIGVLSGIAGDEWSLGFVVETERQVEAHLSAHLSELPENDKKSRVILEKMQAEEIAHAHHAQDAGAHELPWLVKKGMTGMSKVMTSLARYV